MEYHAYADEAYQDGHRYRSIALCSVPATEASVLSGSIASILAKYQIQELKWSKLRSATYRFASLETIALALPAVNSGLLRIDVLTWDTADSRHAIAPRDDNENFARMYYHLGQSAMRKHPAGARWVLFPDEKLGVNWQTLNDCLRAKGKHLNGTPTPLLRDFVSDQHYRLESLKTVKSHEAPLCQLADMFAGLASFSHAEFDSYAKWIAPETDELGLFADQPALSVSDAKAEKLRVLRELKRHCDYLKLGVSLNSTRRLETKDPRRPLNFWVYRPQSPHDKAPIKIG